MNDIFKPNGDLSPRVVELAKRLDRLPPGNYEIIIEKPEVKTLEWSGVIRDLERGVNLERFILPRKGEATYLPE